MFVSGKMEIREMYLKKKFFMEIQILPKFADAFMKSKAVSGTPLGI